MDLDALPGIKVEFPDPNNIMTFKVYIKPSDGLYKGAEYIFNLVIPASYPYDPPTVTCETLVSVSLCPHPISLNIFIASTYNKATVIRSNN